MVREWTPPLLSRLVPTQSHVLGTSPSQPGQPGAAQSAQCPALQYPLLLQCPVSSPAVASTALRPPHLLPPCRSSCQSSAFPMISPCSQQVLSLQGQDQLATGSKDAHTHTVLQPSSLPSTCALAAPPPCGLGEILMALEPYFNSIHSSLILTLPGRLSCFLDQIHGVSLAMNNLL